MADILIRGLSDAAVVRIDEQASELGLSRNEFLRRAFESAASRAQVPATVTDVDWARSATVFADLGDDDVMDAAWR